MKPTTDKMMTFTTRIEQYDFLLTLGYRQDNGQWRDPWYKTILDEDEEQDWKWTTPEAFLLLAFDQIHRRAFEKGQAELRNDVRALVAKLGIR